MSFGSVPKFTEDVLLDDIFLLVRCIPNEGALRVKRESYEILCVPTFSIFEILELFPGLGVARDPVPPNFGTEYLVAND